jgi:hypothetical protein
MAQALLNLNHAPPPPPPDFLADLIAIDYSSPESEADTRARVKVRPAAAAAAVCGDAPPFRRRVFSAGVFLRGAPETGAATGQGAARLLATLLATLLARGGSAKRALLVAAHTPPARRHLPSRRWSTRGRPGPRPPPHRPT